MTDKELSHDLDGSAHIRTDFRNRTSVSNITMANLSVHDLDIFHQDSFNSTKPNTGAVYVDKGLVELENTTFHSSIPIESDRYEVFIPMDTIADDQSVPGIIDISTIIDNEPEIRPTLTFENDVDFNFTVQSVCELDIPDLTDLKVAPGFTGYDDISDVKSSSQSSDLSTDASSLLFNIWNEDYDGNPDPKMMKKLIAAKHLPEGIDPAAECHIRREKILSQLRTLEDDDSSQGSCHIFLQKHWLGRIICGFEENSDCDSMVDSIVDTVIVVNDNSDAESENSLVLQDLDFKKPKKEKSQYALVPDNQYRPDMDVINHQLVLMLPKSATLTGYKDVKNPYLPVQRVVRMEDEEDDFDGRKMGDGYFEKEMEFTLQKYDSTPQRIAELVMKGKFSEAKTYDVSDDSLATPTTISEPIDLSDYIIKERRIPFDDDYVEADRSIAGTVECEGDESMEGSCIADEDDLSVQDCAWNEEVVLATLMPIGILSDDDAAILSRGGIVPIESAESELTFETTLQPQNDIESASNRESIEPDTRKEKQEPLGDHGLDKEYSPVKAVSTSDTSISSADIYSLARLSAEPKEGDILLESNASVTFDFEAKSSELEGNRVSIPVDLRGKENVQKSDLAIKSEEITNNTAEASITSMPIEPDKSPVEENSEEIKKDIGLVHDIVSCSLSASTCTIAKLSKQQSDCCCPSSENYITKPRQKIGIPTTDSCNLLDPQSTLSILKKDHISNNVYNGFTDAEDGNLITIDSKAGRNEPSIEENRNNIMDSDTVPKTFVRRENSSPPNKSYIPAIALNERLLNQNDSNRADRSVVSKKNTASNNVKEYPEPLIATPTLNAFNISVVTPSVNSISVQEVERSNIPATNSYTSISSNNSQRKSSIEQNKEFDVSSSCEEKSDSIISRQVPEPNCKVHSTTDQDKEKRLATKHSVDQSLIRWKRAMDARSLNGPSGNKAPGTVSACDTFLLSVSRVIAQKKTKGDIYQSPMALAFSETKSTIGESSSRRRKLLKTANFRGNTVADGAERLILDNKNGKVDSLLMSSVDMSQMHDVSLLLDITYESDSSSECSHTDLTQSVDVSKLEMTQDDELHNIDHAVVENEGKKSYSKKNTELNDKKIPSLSVKSKTMPSPCNSYALREQNKVQINELLDRMKESSKLSAEQECINNELSLLKMAMLKRRSLGQARRVNSAAKI